VSEEEARMERTSLGDLVDGHRVVVCVGSGGVGKTTTAAALALQGALAGRRAMVLTIDPAKRLAQSLGLDALASGGERIAPELFRSAGLQASGSLSAGMLDQKSAWDEFIARHAPSEEVRDTILANEFYQHLSRSFAGSAEYMAIEELCRIDESGDYDLIVLDTPPTGHALDFLEAPRRLEDFLDRSVVGWLVKPYVSIGWSAWKTASRTVRFIFSRIEDATGVQTLREVSAFFVAMEKLFDGIAERSRKVRALLAGDACAFVLVAGPEEQVLGESEHLTTKMRELGMPLKGVVMNRVHPLPCLGSEGGAADPSIADFDPPDGATLGKMLEPLRAAGIEDAVITWLVETYLEACTIARAEDIRREAFEAGLDSAVAVVVVPELDHDVHDLGDLAAVAAYLCDATAAPGSTRS
jgi:anion-transporting  ArsA/GET3 family ATPase